MKKILIVLLSLILVICMSSCMFPRLPFNEGTSSGTQQEDETTVVVMEDVLFEYEGIRITLTGWLAKGYAGPELKLLIENDTEGDISVTCKNVSINDFMVSALIYESLPAGKKSNTQIRFFSSNLEDNGIETVETIEFQFHIVDHVTYDTIIDSDIITVTIP